MGQGSVVEQEPGVSRAVATRLDLRIAGMSCAA